MLKGYEVRQLIKFFNQSTLQEFEVEKGDFKITLKKGNIISLAEQDLPQVSEEESSELEVKNI